MANISEIGKNLSVLIITTNDLDWQTFGAWYGVHKNLPEAQVVIGCVRNKEIPFQYFQWTKRLKVPLFYINPFSEEFQANRLYVFRAAHSSLPENVLIINPYTMVIDPLSLELVEAINSADPFLWADGKVWLSHNMPRGDIDEMINQHFLEKLEIEPPPKKLVKDAKEEGLHSIVSIEKGCGRWLHTAKGCPFSNAGNLVSDSMSINENRIIELWKRMVILYSTSA